MTGPASAGDEASQELRRRRRRFRRRLRRRLQIAVEASIIGFVIVVAAAAWILLHALDATGRLSDARDDISRVRQDLIAGRDARADLLAAQADARAADHATHDFVWAAASWLPPVETARGITAAIPTDAYRVVLDERGRDSSTRELASRLEKWQMEGRDVAFIIGGADGLHESVAREADWVWSLSRLTLPHALVRVVVAEQLYRAHSILKNHPYHRD